MTAKERAAIRSVTHGLERIEKMIDSYLELSPSPTIKNIRDRVHKINKSIIYILQMRR